MAHPERLGILQQGLQTGNAIGDWIRRRNFLARWLFEKHPATFESEFDIEESVQRLASHVQRKAFFKRRWPEMMGQVRAHKVYLCRQGRFHTSSNKNTVRPPFFYKLPAFYGAFQVREGKTILEGHFSPSHHFKVFVFVWLADVIVIALGPTCLSFMDAGTTMAISDVQGLLFCTHLFYIVLILGSLFCVAAKRAMPKVTPDFACRIQAILQPSAATAIVDSAEQEVSLLDQPLRLSNATLGRLILLNVFLIVLLGGWLVRSHFQPASAFAPPGVVSPSSVTDTWLHQQGETASVLEISLGNTLGVAQPFKSSLNGKRVLQIKDRQGIRAVFQAFEDSSPFENSIVPHKPFVVSLFIINKLSVNMYLTQQSGRYSLLFFSANELSATTNPASAQRLLQVLRSATAKAERKQTGYYFCTCTTTTTPCCINR